MMAYVERFTAHEKASQNSGALPSRTLRRLHGRVPRPTVDNKG